MRPNKNKISFGNGQGDTLAGIIDTPREVASGMALFSHCFTCSKDSLAAARICNALAENRIAACRFDFTGLNDSAGNFSDSNFTTNVEDLLTAADYLTRKHQPPSLLVGHSLGGAAAVCAAKQLATVKAVALINTPSDTSHLLERLKEAMVEVEERGEACVQVEKHKVFIKQQLIDNLRTQKLDITRIYVLRFLPY